MTKRQQSKKSNLFKTAVIVFSVSFIFVSALFTGPPKRTIELNGAKLNYELADSPKERTRGLSGRKQLPPDTVLLFQFDQTGELVAWLKKDFNLGHGHCMAIWKYFKDEGWVNSK